MSEHDTARSVVEFASSVVNRFTMTAQELADDLALLGKHGADWPRCSATQWRRVIAGLIESGELVSDEHEHIGPRPEEQSVKQLELF